MSLLSTFTSASINAWRGIGSSGYINNYVIPPPAPITTNLNFGYNCIISGNGNYCAITTWTSPSTSRVHVFVRNSDGSWSLQYTISGISNPTQSPIAMNYDGNVLSFPGFGGSWPLYIYTRIGTTWSLSQTISLGGSSQFEVESLDMDSTGNYIFCGQSQFSTNRGRVAVYYKSGSTWTLLSTILPSDSTVNTRFGVSVSTNSDASYVVVGCPLTNSSNGAVYVFNGIGTWTQQQKITSFTGFGNGGTAFIVGVNNIGDYLFFNMNSTIPGVPSRVYVYTRSGSSWTQQQILYGSVTDAGNSFGVNGVAINGDASILVIKAYSEDYDSTIRAGKIYIFNRINSTWTTTQTCSSTPLQTDSMTDVAYQGIDISSDGSIFMFSAPLINIYGTGAGAVFVFTN